MSFNFKAFPTLKTERILLRELSFDDIHVIYELRSNEDINKLISRKVQKNLDDVTKFITICHQEYKNENRIFWAIEFKKQVVGTIVFHKITLEKNYAEIGYELHPKFQQKGIMSEAIKTILEFGIHQMKLNTIEANTHKNNIASIALLKKHHFVFQEERRDKNVKANRIWKLEIKN